MEKLRGEDLRKILEECGFRFSKSLGQNFLTDLRILNKIADDACIPENACILEIGPGAGTLTRVLAQRAAKVVSVEIDSALLPVLARTLEGCTNVTVLHGNIMKLDMRELFDQLLAPDFLLVANLPYYITTPILMKLLESGLPYRSATVLVQREVALRMAALPGTSTYGALSCAVQYYTKPVLCSRIPPNCFFPAPKVESQVIRLERHTSPPVSVQDEKLLFQVVQAAFAMRRKTLANNLITAFSLPRASAEELLQKAGLDEKVRGETLSLAQFAQLADMLYEIKKD